MRYKSNIWYQTGGDVNPAQHGGIFCLADGDRTTCVEIDSTEDTDIDDGPFVVTRIDIDDDDLRKFLANDGARASMDFPDEWRADMRLTRALRFAIAEDFMRYQGSSWQGDSVVCGADGLPFDAAIDWDGTPVDMAAFSKEAARWLLERMEG